MTESTLASDRTAGILAQLAPLRTALLEHPIYAKIDSLAGLTTFMEHHVYAVWDFMSLLKDLQRRVCCVTVPWTPPADSVACRLINEIVLGEESDRTRSGGYGSHFDLYLLAMRACGARTAGIERFLQRLRAGANVSTALAEAEAPAGVRDFAGQTFATIDRNHPCATAAAFAFGREDLLPAVFERIVARLNVAADGRLSDFQYYLARHIELDGDEHGPMSHQLVANLCGDDPANWLIAEQAAVASLAARLRLWDAMAAAIG